MPVHLIQTNSMFTGFSIEHRHVLREDAIMNQICLPPCCFFLLSLCQLCFWGKGVQIRIGYRRAVYVLLNLGPTGTPLFSLLLTTNEISVRCLTLVTERCLRMRINTLFIRCLSTEPVFECFTPSMNGAAWGYTTFSSVFREIWSPRYLNTWIKAIKRLWRALRDDYAKPSRHMLIFFFCLNFRHVLLQLYMRQVYRSIYFTIFSSLLDVWKVRAGIREKLVTVLYSRQSDRICYFFYFQLNTELCCTAVNQSSTRAVVDSCFSNLS